jgi:hypothetical protein
LLEGLGVYLPQWIQTDYVTAHGGFLEAEALMQGGKLFENLDFALQSAHTAWSLSPTFYGLHLIFDLPALFIIVLSNTEKIAAPIITMITSVTYIGNRYSANATHAGRHTRQLNGLKSSFNFL